jgi:hypothetical protein
MTYYPTRRSSSLNNKLLSAFAEHQPQQVGAVGPPLGPRTIAAPARDEHVRPARDARVQRPHQAGARGGHELAVDPGVERGHPGVAYTLNAKANFETSFSHLCGSMVETRRSQVMYKLHSSTNCTAPTPAPHRQLTVAGGGLGSGPCARVATTPGCQIGYMDPILAVIIHWCWVGTPPGVRLVTWTILAGLHQLVLCLQHNVESASPTVRGAAQHPAPHGQRRRDDLVVAV